MPARNPSSPPRAADLAPARRLWRDYLSRYWPRLALGGAAMAAYAASYSAIPIAVEWINTAIAAYGGGEREALHGLLFLAPALIIGLGVVNAAAQYVQSRLTASAALAAMRDLQADMHARLLAVDEAQVRALGSGQAVSRFVGDPAALREMLMRVITAARDLMTLAGVCFVMARFDWVLFLVVAAVYAILGWPVSLIGKRLRDSARAAQAQAGDIASLIAETTANARIIRAFNLEAPERARGRAAFDERLKRLDRAWALRAANEPFVFVVGAIAFAIVVATVALRLQSGALDGPQFIAFIIALLMLSQPARGLSTLNAVAQEGLAAFERMVELVDIAPTVRAAAGAPALHVVGGEVVFRDVAFSYDGRQPALDGVSFTAPAGKTLALVGMSGAGKSTLFALLLRAYDAARGEILIDGHDIKAVDISSLRAAIAIVAQEPMLFDDTVAANIARGRAGAVRSQIEDAARAADAHDFIIALPQGYETRIGEGGGLLSGGQRQRIAIARAFLKDAPILLLDEATAALDAASEAQIHAALERLARGRTTIVAAHRLSTVRRADRIVALADGRIIEQGDHEGLVAANGYYARVVRLQMTDS